MTEIRLDVAARVAVRVCESTARAMREGIPLALSLAVGIAMGCDTGPVSPLDVIGAPEDVVESKSVELLSDKAPSFDPQLTVTEEFDGCRMTLNKSSAVTRLTIARPDKEIEGVAGSIFATRGEALQALGLRPVIPSMEVINGMLKPFNDGLYAAVELAAEAGEDGSSIDKRATFDALLSSMLNANAKGVAGAQEAAVHFAAASLLAEGALAVPDDIATAAGRSVDAFRSDAFTATPIGFYTWTPQLRRVFARDRFLQYALPPGLLGFEPAAALADALGSESALAADYRRILELYRGITNPSQHFDPLALLVSEPTTGASEVRSAAEFRAAYPELDGTPPCQAGFSWLPPSESPERKLIATQYCSGTPPADLLGALVEAIQSGAIDLQPTAGSGWYDWQLYALETLLVPERGSENERLLLTQQYRDKLVETFKSLLIQTRETHVKQLGTVSIPTSASIQPPREVDVYPALPVEPFPTFYLRTARAYGFVAGVLRATLGVPFLESTPRVLEDGSRHASTLGVELAQKTELLYGLHLVAAASIGMRDELTDDERAMFEPGAAERVARDWLSAWTLDPDVWVDPRVSVPLVADRDTGLTRNLAVVGVKLIRMSASYPEGREPKLVQGDCTIREFVAYEPYMLVEQSLEYSRPIDLPPLNRDELRAILDPHGSLDGIRAALEAR